MSFAVHLAQGPPPLVDDAVERFETACAMRTAVLHLALIGADDRRAVVACRPALAPGERAAAFDDLGRGPGRTLLRLPIEIELLGRIGIPDAELAAHELLAFRVPDQLRLAAPVAGGSRRSDRICDRSF